MRAPGKGGRGVAASPSGTDIYKSNLYAERPRVHVARGLQIGHSLAHSKLSLHCLQGLGIFLFSSHTARHRARGITPASGGRSHGDSQAAAVQPGGLTACRDYRPVPRRPTCVTRRSRPACMQRCSPGLSPGPPPAPPAAPAAAAARVRTPLSSMRFRRAHQRCAYTLTRCMHYY